MIATKSDDVDDALCSDDDDVHADITIHLKSSLGNHETHAYARNKCCIIYSYIEASVLN